MKDRKLARRYARALLSALPDVPTAERVGSFLEALGRAFEDSAELSAVLHDPAYPREVRKSVLQALGEGRSLPPQVGRFLDTLVENNRIAALPTIADVFGELREQEQGIVAAEITTASPLAPELEERARAALERVTGRTVRLTCRVDPALIGGAVARMGSTVYDGSLRTQLQMLRRRLVQE